VESGYRSPAYQLYLFIFYLVQHDYSVRETARWNAFPGYSEHGFPDRQALDFITADGVSGEQDPELFESREEYAWLLAHAAEYGFFLSYPKDNPQGIGFEPWHWHHEKRTGEA
jgi:D-alanyl-D-alanine carboxypeptidase